MDIIFHFSTFGSLATFSLLLLRRLLLVELELELWLLFELDEQGRGRAISRHHRARYSVSSFDSLAHSAELEVEMCSQLASPTLKLLFRKSLIEIGLAPERRQREKLFHDLAGELSDGTSEECGRFLPPAGQQVASVQRRRRGEAKPCDCRPTSTREFGHLSEWSWRFELGSRGVSGAVVRPVSRAANEQCGQSHSALIRAHQKGAEINFIPGR